MPAPDLYNKILIDHYKSPEHRGVPDSWTYSGTGYNHNCGDEITVYLTVSGETIEDASFEGKGCMICQASASVMAGELKGKSVARALRSISHLNHLLKGETEISDLETRGPDYIALSGIREFPMRIKCATLAWDTAAKLLQSTGSEITSE